MFKMRTTSIRIKLFFLLAILLAISLSLQLFYISPMLEKNDKQELEIYQNGIANQIAQFIDMNFHAYQVELEILARTSSIVSMKKEELDRTISQMDTLTQFFNYFFVTDTEGRWVSYPSKQHMVGKKINNDPWVQETIDKDKTNYLDIHLARRINTLVSGFATPIRDNHSKIQGILRGVITISQENALLKMVKSFKFGKNGYVFLVDSNGRPIAHPDFTLEPGSFETINLINLPPVQQSLAGASGIVEYTYNSKKFTAAYRPIETTGWGLVVQQPTEDISLHVKDEVSTITYTYFSFLIITFLLLGVVASKSLTPLTNLLRSLQRQSFKPGLDLPKDEIGLLAKEFESIFSQMRKAEEDLNDALEGQEKTVAERTKELLDSNQKLTHEIEERTRAEQALRDSEERYRSLFENATDIIQVVRPDGKMLYVNPSWCEILGYSEAEANNLTIFDLIHPECRDLCELHFKDTLTKGTSGLIETSFKTKDGRKVVLQGSSNCKFTNDEPSLVFCIFQDVTERRIMEAELAKMHKLESVGILAGGIAHDFNNILTAITGNLSLARAQIEPGQEVIKRIEEAEKATLRAKDLTQQLLTFSKGGEPIKSTTSLIELIKDSCSFVLRGTNVKCVYELPENLSLVEVDNGQISQVIHNLVINAKQAMPDGGTLNIHAENVHLSSGDVEPLCEGNYVLVRIEDQGVGITAKHLIKIFDPYFSTKHEGHGLGLASAYSIIKKHDGLLTASSQLGKGSAFMFYLPTSKNTHVSQPAAGAELHFGQGSVLLMDDEAPVREIGRKIIEHLGYKVSLAVDGGQVLEMYNEALDKNSPFAVVILDLTVPGGMGGEEAFRELMKIDPSVRVIVSSGYANDPIMANYQQYGLSGVVPKPYKIEDMSKALKNLLNTN